MSDVTRMNKSKLMNMENTDGMKEEKAESCQDGNLEAVTVQPAPCFPSARLTVAMLTYMMGVCNYLMRANLSVAIVCMNSDSFALVAESNDSFRNDTALGLNGTLLNSTQGDFTPEVKEFQWDRQLRGLILGAFSIGYVPFQIPLGTLANRFGGKWPLFGGMCFLTIGTFLGPVSARVSPYMLLVLQVLKGVACAGVYPSIYHLMGRWAPLQERSRICAFMTSGSNAGILISYGLSGWLCDNGFAGGWPSLFYVYAIFTSVWLILYVFLVYNGPDSHPRISQRERMYIEAEIGHLEEVHSIPWRAIFSSVPFYAIVFADICADWLWYTGMMSLAQYIHDVLKFSMTKIGIVSAFAYLLSGISAWPAGWIADGLINKGLLSVTNVRKLFCAIGILGPSICLICLSFLDHRQPVLAIICLLITFALLGCYRLGHYATMLDFAPRYLGVVKSISNTVANVSGFIVPVITGALTSHGTRKQWQHVYIVTAAICAVGVVQFAIFASAELQSWARDRSTEDTDENAPVSEKTTTT